MGLRFYRRVRIAPGFTLNLGKRGASVSVGRRGLHTTFGTHGIRNTVGLPGTGLYYTQSSSRSKTSRSRQSTIVGPIGIFSSLIIAAIIRVLIIPDDWSAGVTVGIWATIYIGSRLFYYSQRA